jgi:hypothetical protein
MSAFAFNFALAIHVDPRACDLAPARKPKAVAGTAISTLSSVFRLRETHAYSSIVQEILTFQEGSSAHTNTSDYALVARAGPLRSAVARQPYLIWV